MKMRDHSLERTGDARRFIFVATVFGGRNSRLIHETGPIMWKDVYWIVGLPVQFHSAAFSKPFRWRADERENKAA